MYKYAYGVMLNACIGNSEWLSSLLGLEANYFEVWITNGSMGLSNESARQHSHVGWDKGTMGYHSDDGTIHINGISFKTKSGGFVEKDTVGCGFYTLQENQWIFFTRSGRIVHEAQLQRKPSCETLFPKMCFQNRDGRGCFNMGDRPFAFDVVDYLLQKKSVQ
eukprot:Phypoly_transcript_13460.p1 GENE.Phypoly_transcript_13460~~Phypoly_transcript_13460.p1  ORF type:complete len:163 (+),score=18.04 Phypoly_transcript_13460:528-1016(+)